MIRFFGIPSGYYGTLGAYQSYEWARGYYNDMDRFWADYKKNTGFSPKYPYKSGLYYDKGSLSYSKKAIFDSLEPYSYRMW